MDVPYLVGEMYSDDFAYKYEDFSIKKQPAQYDDVYEKGRVMAQEPSGGSKVVRGTELWITVSNGPEPETTVMINLVDVDEAQAKELIGDDYKIVIRREPSYIYGKGQVTRTDPIEGEVLTKGATVNIWISTGPEIITEKMPDVIGLSKEAALKVLSPLGFENVDFDEVESNKPKGTVVYQSEPKHTELDVTTEIILEISQGPTEEETKPPRRTGKMINVTMLNVEVAKQELKRAGFTGTITVVEVESEREVGRVVLQSPQKEQEMDFNDPITLQVSLGPGVSTTPAGEEEGDTVARITCTLPPMDEDFLLTFKLAGKQVGDAIMIPAGQTQYTVEVIGSGVQTLDMYINGELNQSQEVEFSAYD